MIIYIELLVVGVLLALLFIWGAYIILSKKFYKWRYKPENDRGKKGEEFRQELIQQGRADREGTSTRTGSPNLEGERFTDERTNLSPTNSLSVGKTSKSNGKTRRRYRNVFTRR